MDDQSELTREQLDAVSAGYEIVQADNGKWMLLGRTDAVFDSYQEAHDFLWQVVWAERG